MQTLMTPDRKTRRLVLWIYGAALLYFVLKQVYFAVWVRGFPDQMAHLSYVLEMCRRPALIPDFASLHNFREIAEQNGQTIYELSGYGINYLTHPPLYYLLMASLSGCTVLTEETLMVNVLRLRVLNIILTSSAVALAFYLGGTRLKNRSPLVHALYAAAIVTLPMLAYVGASVNNDNLAFLAFVIFFAGLVRYQEDKLDLRTYLLIGGGFFLGSLSKLTMALICALMLVAVLIMNILRTKSLKLVFCRNFLVTLPFYLLPLVYILLIRQRYGTWQPSLYDVDRDYYYTTVFYVAPENRVPITLVSYAFRFLKGMGYTWSSLYSHNYEVAMIMHNGLSGMIYWVPVALALFAALRQCVRRRFDRITVPVVFAFLGTMAYNFYSNWRGYPISGYLGAISARYYLALIVPFAWISADLLAPFLEKHRAAGRILTALLVLCWLCGDAARLVIQYGFPVPD